MSTKATGLLLTASGVALIIIGLLMLGGSPELQPSTTTTIVAAPTTTTTAPPTTSTTTTTAPTTTTLPPETVEEFVAAYRAALDGNDAEFLFARLHPSVVEAYGADMCRSWVEREVVALDNYQIAGEVTGPADQMFTAPDGSQFAVADTFATTVTFTFEGEDFETDAGFALVEGVMHWLGTCT